MKLYGDSSAAETVTDALVDDVLGVNDAATDRVSKLGVISASEPVSPLRPADAAATHRGVRTVQLAEISAIEELGAQQALTPIRMLQTFSYSVNLFLCRFDLTYYITLCQNGKPWRAVHAAELDTAEGAFRVFEEQAVRLADVELRYAQLVAQNERMEEMIASSEAQAEQLRNDLAHHADQTQLVNGRQQELRKEVAQLEMRRVASQARLNKALRQINQLRATSNERIPRLSIRKTES